MTTADEYEYFLTTACDALRVKVDEARGGERSRRAVYARRVVAICLRERGYSLPEIAEAMGLKAHTTVLRLIQGFWRRQGVPDNKVEDIARAKALAGRLVREAKRNDAAPPPKVEEPLPVTPRDKWHEEWLRALRRVSNTFVNEQAGAWEHECRRLFPYSWRGQAAVLPRELRA